jgi:serine O-acetyltransferase
MLLVKFFKLIFFPDYRIKIYMKLLYFFRVSGRENLALFIYHRLRGYGLVISPKAIISKNVSFPHPTAVVIGKGVVVEDGVTVFHSVTLGGSRQGDATSNNMPVIKKNTIIYSGVAVLGGVTIGEGCIIGANSVVIHNIPDNSVAVGAPAKIIKLREEKL